MIAEYERVLPGSAHRIITMAENEQALRHEVTRNFVRTQSSMAKVGQRFAFLIAIAGLVACVALGLANQAVASIFIGTVDIVSLVALFIAGSRSQPSGQGGQAENQGTVRQQPQLSRAQRRANTRRK
ncbi:MAG: DUF2335 domain-containing protein [Candidatus Limnocylindrales bacterium]